MDGWNATNDVAMMALGVWCMAVQLKSVEVQLKQNSRSFKFFLSVCTNARPKRTMKNFRIPNNSWKTVWTYYVFTASSLIVWWEFLAAVKIHSCFLVFSIGDLSKSIHSSHPQVTIVVSFSLQFDFRSSVDAKFILDGNPRKPWKANFPKSQSCFGGPLGGNFFDHG